MVEDHFVSTSIFDFEENGEECTLLYVPHVCVIESPSKDDRIINRREGTIICDSLRVANIRNKLLDVSSKSDFFNALNEIATFAAPVKLIKISGQKRKCCIPRLFLHISCHGNEDGIAFSNGDFLTWLELKDNLTDLTKQLQLFNPDNASAACMTLCMSSCCGLHARAMAEDKNAIPFHALVGCNSDIEWTDSITAYQTFYHQVITKERSVPRAIKTVNEAAMSKDIFELITAYDVGAVGFSKVTPVVIMSADINGKLRWFYDTRVGKPHIPFLWSRDNLLDPDTMQPILDPTTGKTPIYFDDPESAVEFMQSNREQFCQVERGAAQDIKIKYAHKF